MKHLLSFIPVFFILWNCQSSDESEKYEIYNTVLKEKVSTYGIMASYLPNDRHYSDTELDSLAKRISDSLKATKSLTYFLDEKLTVLDTLNPDDAFPSEQSDAVIEFRPTYSKNKLDFSKLKTLELAERLGKPIPIDENKKGPTYLGNYDLSEPVFIGKNLAAIRFQHYCGGKCGVGLLIHLQKTNGSWKIIREKLIWIS